ncbi:hypothetical protein BC828DRAFT_373008, partial [Blastocladiella britannica]
MVCGPTEPDYDLAGASRAVGSLFELACAAPMSLEIAHVFTNAAVVLCQHSDVEFDQLNLVVMLGQVLDRPNSIVTRTLFERVEDIPAVFAGAMVSDFLEDSTPAVTLSRLLRLPLNATNQNANRNLTVQCARALASIGGWDQIWAAISNAESKHLPGLFTHVVRLCFGRVEFLVAVGTPPTHQWCTRFVERCIQGRTITDADVAMIMANLAQWEDSTVDMAVRLDALQALSDQLLFAKANVRLLFGMDDALDPHQVGVRLYFPLKAFLHHVTDAINSTCPQHIASPLEHSESHCAQCTERILSLM